MNRNTIIYILIFNFLSLIDAINNGKKVEYGCIQKDFGFGSFVCVCNSTFCDTLTPIEAPPKGNILVVTSNKKNKRWFVETKSFSDEKQEIDPDVVITVNRSMSFQTILGFGGAFTDAAGINILSVSGDIQEHIFKSYFDEDGLEYNLGRVPIGGTDFSTHPYTYDDLAPGQIDPHLKHFKLTEEDFKYKIPLVKRAMMRSSKRGVQMKLVGSPWSGPGWMKDNGMINGNGQLLKNFYASWAAYIIKFLHEYSKYGIEFYGVTTQNEPTAGYNFNYSFNQMAWAPEDQGIWISRYFGPQLHDAGFQNVSIFALDDMRFLLPTWIKKLFRNTTASKYVGGVGVHWYYDFISPAKFLDKTHSLFPNLPILYTEACSGWAPWDLKKVVMGSWVRAESYAQNIIEDLQNWVVGWIDWNLALNLKGGPNWAKNFVDAPIIVNQAEQEIYKQPMFYALAHFTKTIPEGSQRIRHKVEGQNRQYIDLVSFIRPDKSTAIILINKNHFSMTAKLMQNESSSFSFVIEPRSIISLVWRIE